MNISQEFFKIKDGFRKVKDDMNFISSKITENYDDFIQKHSSLNNQIQELSKKLNSEIKEIKEKGLNSFNHLEPSELLYLKSEIKELKKEIFETHHNHSQISENINNIKKNKKEIKEIKEKLHTSELELYLLKERLIEKDVEMKQIKEVSKHLFNIVEDLSKTELELINIKNK